MGTASAFGVLANAGVTNTGATIVNGNIGTIDRGFTGFPPGIVTGTEVAGAAAMTAQADFLAAFAAARNMTATHNLSVAQAELNGVTLTPGIYAVEQGASVVGTVTLDGPGMFIFQIPSTLSTVDNSNVVLTGGATAENVFWTADNPIVLGANSTIVGSLISLSAVHLGSGAVVEGGVFTSGDNIILVDNTISVL